ncbi:MAG TPA: biopolymer transporter ExbD, partial [Vicinamibacteria bacterium]|nr:biopolymer transporter ExbD [Vicinamibacteria bacterium]
SSSATSPSVQAAGGSNEAGGHAAATYRGLRRRTGAAALGEINVTPLVDVVLVLLLVFMVTAPMMSRGIDVSLPVADQPQTDPEERVTISINAREQIFIGDRPVNALLLEDRLRGMMEGRVSKVVYLRADEGLRYGKVIEVVDRIKKAGVEQIGFVYVLPGEKARK